MWKGGELREYVLGKNTPQKCNGNQNILFIMYVAQTLDKQKDLGGCILELLGQYNYYKNLISYTNITIAPYFYKRSDSWNCKHVRDGKSQIFHFRECLPHLYKARIFVLCVIDWCISSTQNNTWPIVLPSKFLMDEYIPRLV